jgi:hypothetical protein
VGYTERGTGSARKEELVDSFPYEKTEALTAAALLVRRYAGVREDRLDHVQLGRMRGVPPYPDIPDMYYWHLGTRAFVGVGGGKVRSYAGSPPVGPQGHKRTPKGRERLSRAGPYGCLLGRVGREGKTFPLKRETKLRVKDRGELILLVNDADPSRATGRFQVELVLKE